MTSPDPKPEFRIKHDPFMAGFLLEIDLLPRYDLTDEEKDRVREVVFETICGRTPFRNWREAARAYCKGFEKEKKQRRKQSERNSRQ